MTIELRPDQERILKEALRQGRFHSMEEALDRAIQSIVVQEGPTYELPRGAKSLVEVFAPLQGLDLDFSRNQSNGRSVKR